jgi:hypothetical protein
VWGHQVEAAEDGERGLDLLRASRPEVALIEAAGFDAHLVKPVDPDALQRVLAALGAEWNKPSAVDRWGRGVGGAGGRS